MARSFKLVSTTTEHKLAFCICFKADVLNYILKHTCGWQQRNVHQVIIALNPDYMWYLHHFKEIGCIHPVLLIQTPPQWAPSAFSLSHNGHIQKEWQGADMKAYG